MALSRFGLASTVLLLSIAFARAGIVGPYVGWLVTNDPRGERGEAPDKYAPKIELRLNPDGTFAEAFENHVMSNIIESSVGTYKVSGSEVFFSGISTFSMDDGYTKSSGKRPYIRTMRYEHGDLVLYLDKMSALDKGAAFVYRPKGSKQPEHFPALIPRSSNPAASKILREVEAHYAALRWYSDDASYTSLGSTELPKKALIRIRFSSPKKCLFELTDLDAGKPRLDNAIWSNGTKSWLYKRGYQPAPEERELALSFGTVGAGSDCTAVIRLLILKSMDVFANGDLPISLRSEEDLSGRACFVEAFRHLTGAEATIWIEKSTYTIVRTYDAESGIRIDYHPKLDVRIPNSEFEFRTLSSKGKHGAVL